MNEPAIQPAVQPAIQPAVQPAIQPAVQPAVQPVTPAQIGGAIAFAFFMFIIIMLAWNNFKKKKKKPSTLRSDELLKRAKSAEDDAKLLKHQQTQIEETARVDLQLATNSGDVNAVQTIIANSNQTINSIKQDLEEKKREAADLRQQHREEEAADHQRDIDANNEESKKLLDEIAAMNDAMDKEDIESNNDFKNSLNSSQQETTDGPPDIQGDDDPNINQPVALSASLLINR